MMDNAERRMGYTEIKIELAEIKGKLETIIAQNADGHSRIEERHENLQKQTDKNTKQIEGNGELGLNREVQRLNSTVQGLAKQMRSFKHFAMAIFIPVIVAAILWAAKTGLDILIRSL